MTLPKVLLFDLGGVIVPWVGIIELSRIKGLSEADILVKASKSDIFSAYEIGDCSTDVFLDELARMFNLERPALSRLWNEWVQSPYAGTRAALLKLKEQFTIACLSNTNQSHWDYLTDTHNIIDVFDHAYASHIIKAAKPNAKAWQLCLHDMNIAASDVWFFDDTQANIDAAQSMGITSYHVDRNVGVIPTLQSLGLL